jgi:MFS family permease
MIVISLGVGGVGFASGFEHLYICRLLTGLGVAALSTATTLAVTGEYYIVCYFREYHMTLCSMVVIEFPF